MRAAARARGHPRTSRALDGRRDSQRRTPTDDDARRGRDVERGQPAASAPIVPSASAAAERDAVPQRRQPGDRLERAPAGSSTGKNVPENRNSGVIPKRKMRVEAVRASAGSPRRRRSASRRRARSGPRPGCRGRSSGERRRRRATMTSDEDRARSSSAGSRSRRGCRATMSRGEIGVAYIAWNVRCQIEAGHDRERRLERRRLHRRRREEARARGTAR